MKEITPDINGTKGLSRTGQEKQNKTANTGLTGEFSKILSDHLADDQNLSTESETGLSELGATYAAQLAQASLANSSLIPEQISQTIDLLEQYANHLSNPQSSLKQAYNILGQVSLQANDITSSLEEESDVFSPLKEVLVHLSTLVEVEKIKLNRGDYL